jgi:hypothetical protein
MEFTCWTWVTIPRQPVGFAGRDFQIPNLGIHSKARFCQFCFRLFGLESRKPDPCHAQVQANWNWLGAVYLHVVALDNRT